MIINKLVKNLILNFLLFGLSGCNRFVKSQVVTSKEQNQPVEETKPLAITDASATSSLPWRQNQLTEWSKSSIAFWKKTPWIFLKKQISKKCLNYLNNIMEYKKDTLFIPQDNLFCDHSDYMAQYFLAGSRLLLDPCYHAFVNKTVTKFMELLYNLLADPNFYADTTDTDFKGINFEAAEKLIYKTYRGMPEKIIDDWLVSYLISTAKVFMYNYLPELFSICDSLDQNRTDLIIKDYTLDLILTIVHFGLKECLEHKIGAVRKKLFEYLSKPDSIDNLIKSSKDISNILYDPAAKCADSTVWVYQETSEKGCNLVKHLMRYVSDAPVAGAMNNTFGFSGLWRKSAFGHAFRSISLR